MIEMWKSTIIYESRKICYNWYMVPVKSTNRKIKEQPKKKEGARAMTEQPHPLRCETCKHEWYATEFDKAHVRGCTRTGKIIVVTNRLRVLIGDCPFDAWEPKELRQRGEE